MKHMRSLPIRHGMKALMNLYLSMPSGMKRRSSGSGVKANRNITIDP